MLNKAQWQVAADPVLYAELAGWLESIEQGVAAGQLRGKEAREEYRQYHASHHEARIQIYGTNPFMEFCLWYFDDKMQDPKRGPGIFIPPSWYHHMMTHGLWELAHSTETMVRADALGRGQAKSTYGTEWLNIYMAALELRRNMVIIGASDKDKEYQKRLRNITRQLEGNSALLADYPGLAPAKDIKGQGVGYTDAEIILDCGARMAAMPMGGNIRGQSYEQIRPDHIALDDPETRKMQRSPTQMRENWEWFEEDLIGSLAPGGTILWQGTLLSYHCLLGRVRSPKDEDGKAWPGYTIPLIDQDTGECNWPEYFTPEVVEYFRELHGPRAFEKEHNLKVRGDDEAVFLKDDFNLNRYDPLKLSTLGQFSTKAETVERTKTMSLISYHPWYTGHGQSATFDQRIVGTGQWEYDGRPLTVYAHADLAVSVREAACYTAIAIIGTDYTSEATRYYLLEFLRVKLTQPEQLDLIERVIDFWQPVKFGLEKQHLELAMQQGIMARRSLPEGYFAFVDRSNTNASKLDRIASWVDPVRAGEIQYCMDEGHQSLIKLRRAMDDDSRLLVQSQRILRKEADEFPHGAFIDGLDATESCYTLAKNNQPSRRGPGPDKTRKRRSGDSRYDGWSA